MRQIFFGMERERDAETERYGDRGWPEAEIETETDVYVGF